MVYTHFNTQNPVYESQEFISSHRTPDLIGFTNRIVKVFTPGKVMIENDSPDIKTPNGNIPQVNLS